ncbi:MAG: DUF177 domain-containing protein [Rhodospirillaceae bacterium]|jgi:uncharacterized metal-binding protein YceD (DUF177 family)|nr:DUF177 domain-containing protein [Rhodospirillaceae bacterium]MBT5665475.1 DUF177 domain-containing protein [Rhodospirillaceae bacterium]
MTDKELEFSRVFDTATVGREARAVELTASAAECAALARRLDLEAVKALSASLRVARVGKGPLFRVTGALVADVVQRCVASLEPIEAHIEESVDFRYGPGENSASKRDLDIEFDDQDPPEPMDGDLIELGEPVAQFFSLALDPYPQLPDLDKEGWSPEESAGAAAAPGDDPSRENPFKVLAALKTRRE